MFIGKCLEKSENFMVKACFVKKLIEKLIGKHIEHGE